jgi:hypothetical protein
MTIPILTTKLYIPPLQPNVIHRRRLIKRMNERLFGAAGSFARKLTLVSALGMDSREGGNPS